MLYQSDSQLVERAAAGDASAQQELLQRHRDRLQRMIAVRMDPRVSARLDPSDIVQEALLEAAQKLSKYLETCPIAFYPWLRRIAWERLVKAHEHHIQTQRRSVAREQRWQLSDASVGELAQRLLAKGSSPSAEAIRNERRQQLREALRQLKDSDREHLLLRYVEQLSTQEIADVLEITIGAAKVRHLRALQRLRDLLGDSIEEQAS